MSLTRFLFLNSILFKSVRHFLGITKRRFLRSRKSMAGFLNPLNSSHVYVVQKVHSTQPDQSDLFRATVSGSLKPEASYLGSDISFATLILPPQKTSGVDVFALEKTIQSLQQNHDSGWSGSKLVLLILLLWCSGAANNSSTVVLS